jgi:hypothetical protein
MVQAAAYGGVKVASCSKQPVQLRWPPLPYRWWAALRSLAWYFLVGRSEVCYHMRCVYHRKLTGTCDKQLA